MRLLPPSSYAKGPIREPAGLVLFSAGGLRPSFSQRSFQQPSVPFSGMDTVHFAGQNPSLTHERKQAIDRLMTRLNLPQPQDENAYRMLDRALTPAGGDLQKVDENCEQLEFYGDRVIALAISDMLMQRFPGWNEGQLTHMTQFLVNNKTLILMAQEYQLIDYMNTGHLKHNPLSKDSKRLADCVEALYGAVFLANNKELAVVQQSLWPFIQKVLNVVDVDKLPIKKSYKQYTRDLPDLIAGKRLRRKK
jgi:dsRNA-specific ribonuclease